MSWLHREDPGAERPSDTMWNWYSGDESQPSGAPPANQSAGTMSVADLTDQLAQTQQLVAQLKDLIREKDNELRKKDQDLKDNTIDFLEYVAALNLALRGKLEHKLKWCFKIYDKDGNGCVDKRELREIIQSVYSIKKDWKREPDAQLLSPEEVCDRIFQLVDENGDGQLTLHEFLEGAKKDGWVSKMLQLDTTPCTWVMEQRRKSALF